MVEDLPAWMRTSAHYLKGWGMGETEGHRGTPHQRIVTEIRDRITRGRLRPGDRVPSTRQITQQWGVAMATATKVIAALRDEGLVETRPGAGTVVREARSPAPPIPPRPAVDRDLSRDRVTRRAIEIADAEGLATLSMRRVATELGVATMSLYRHVLSKEELVLLMVDTALAEYPLPARRPVGWRPRLEVAARTFWAAFRRHPWVAEMVSMTQPQAMPNLIGYAEWCLSALREAGFAFEEMMFIHLTLFGHIRSCGLMLQAETRARQDTGRTTDESADEFRPALSRLLDSGAYPTMELLIDNEFDYDLDRIFEYGLNRILDGIAARVPTRLSHP